MAKLNEQLRAELEFKVKEVESDPDFIAGKQVIVSVDHKGIYRQFSFHVGLNAHPQADVEKLIEEGKNILTHTIERALKELPR